MNIITGTEDLNIIHPTVKTVGLSFYTFDTLSLVSWHFNVSCRYWMNIKLNKKEEKWIRAWRLAPAFEQSWDDPSVDQDQINNLINFAIDNETHNCTNKFAVDVCRI